MHAHANTYMATGNYRWLGKGTIQNIHLLRAVVSNVNSLTHVVPNPKKKGVEEYDHSFQYNESECGIKLSSSKITKSTINVCKSGPYDSCSIFSEAIQQICAGYKLNCK